MLAKYLISKKCWDKKSMRQLSDQTKKLSIIIKVKKFVWGSRLINILGISDHRTNQLDLSRIIHLSKKLNKKDKKQKNLKTKSGISY